MQYPPLRGNLTFYLVKRDLLNRSGKGLWCSLEKDPYQGMPSACRARVG
jgi:hypothetical protein